MAQYSPVPCEEVFGTVKESFAATTRSASVTLRCDWANRGALMEDLLNTPRPYPALTNMFAIKCSATPEKSKYTTDTDEQVIFYEKALVSVEYGVPGDLKKEEAPDDPVKQISENIEPYTRVITLDFEQFEWGSPDSQTGDPSLVEGEEPGKILHGVRLARDWYFVTSLPSTLFTLPGSVNNAPYTSNILTYTFPIGTLLFIPPVMSRTLTIDGTSKGWTVKLGWDFNIHGWNNVWRADSENWEPVYKKGKYPTPYNSFPLADHSSVLF